jgi:hypothetical protein
MQVTPKTTFETFLFRPDLLVENKLGKVLLCALDIIFAIGTLGLVHGSMIAKHVFFDTTANTDSRITKIRDLFDKTFHRKAITSTEETLREEIRQHQKDFANSSDANSKYLHLQTVQDKCTELQKLNQDTRNITLTRFIDDISPWIMAQKTANPFLYAMERIKTLQTDFADLSADRQEEALTEIEKSLLDINLLNETTKDAEVDNFIENTRTWLGQRLLSEKEKNLILNIKLGLTNAYFSHASKIRPTNIETIEKYLAQLTAPHATKNNKTLATFLEKTRNDLDKLKRQLSSDASIPD